MHQYSQGKYPTQGHKAIPEGCYEEEQGRKGFFGQVSHLIKTEPSTRWSEIEGPLRPQLFDLVEMQKHYGKTQRLMFNNDVEVSTLWMLHENNPSIAMRNADGDVLYFCHQGSGEVLTEYGLLTYRKGSYINIPKCVTFTLVPKEETQFLVIESKNGSYREPDRGMVGRNAFYDPASFGKPDLDLQIKNINEKKWTITDVFVKRQGLQTRFSYTSNYYDTVGWKGDLFPFTLHIDDMMPMLSHRVHLPPSAHTTFATNGFVVCTFLPRPIESDADALKVPFYHQNIDYDEVLFYHDGDFFSRDNIHANMITFHPAGFPHGPHPKAFQNQQKKTFTNEVAVMIDTWNPLIIDSPLESVERKDYWKSWMTK